MEKENDKTKNYNINNSNETNKTKKEDKLKNQETQVLKENDSSRETKIIKHSDNDRDTKILRTSNDSSIDDTKIINNDNLEETKIMKSVDDSKKTKKNKKVEDSKKKDKKQKKKHSKLKKFIIAFIIIIILLCLIGAGVFAAIFFGDTWNMTEDDLVIKMQNSITYDSEGNVLHEIRGEENRKIIPLSEMGEYIPKAYVAIEDERFYKHSGIDIYRTAGAIFTYITNGGSSSFGGSTITQQLVKNLMDDDEDTIERKIREWSRAYKVEQMLSKTQILELYLNEIFVGGSNIHGVESGAKYYFNKSAKDLSLAEAAFMAGINDSPNYYNPFGEEDKTEIINDKTKLVLGKMLEVKDEDGNTFITEEEYAEAVAEVDNGLKFEQGKFSTQSDLSFLEVDAIDQVVEDLMEEYDIDRKAAEDRVYNNGYRIYTTQDSDIQERMEEEYLKDKYIKDATDEDAEEGAHSQSGMVIIDHTNGQVVAEVGGLGDDSPTYGTNRATSMINGGRQTGSSMKPLAAIAPGLEQGVITAATVYDDSPTEFGGQSYGNSTGYPGLITVREAIERSSNIVNMKVLSNVGVSNAVEFLNEIGMPQYNDADKSITLAIGGSTHGSTPLQMAAAYAMIANGGEYIEPTFYTKVEDANGNVILEAEQETKRVMSEGNAYILTSILESPVTGSAGSGHATASMCAISGMDVAAKTGTTTSYKDRWLCGFTPYYAAATWFGYDQPEVISFYNRGMDNPAMYIWDAVMTDIHEDLESASFDKPNNIVKATICLDSGRAATDECTRTYTEEFVSGTVPGKCDGHKKVEICSETGKLATEYCPETKTKTYLSTPEKEVNPNWKTNVGNKYKEITETCDVHTAETMAITVQNVVGMTEAQAREALSGLTIQIVYESDPNSTNGTVLKQSIEANTQAKRGDTITITVNEIQSPTVPDDPNTNTTVPPTPTDPGGTNETTDTNTIVDPPADTNTTV